MSLPEQFINSLESNFGKPVADAFLDSLDTEAVTAVRRNVSKISSDDFEKHFSCASPETVPWCGEGLYLNERPDFTLDPWLHAGCYYVQDASSMAVCEAFKSVSQEMGGSLRVLDLCAAPGGKTTALASMLSGSDLLVANEVIRSRVTILAENMTKWGRANVVVTNNEASDFASLSSYFDIVLADVPCSGEGMFRKDDKAIDEWSVDNVKLCASRQRKIIADVWGALREGGFMIYSTCTFNVHENDENVQWIENELGAEVVRIPFYDGEGAPIQTSKGYQFIPGITRGEGFFFAVLRKISPSAGFRKPKGKQFRAGSRVKCEWVKGGYETLSVKTSSEELIKAYPANIMDEISLIESSVRSVRSGVAVALVKGRDFIPEPALALSEVLADNAFRRVQLSLKEALNYLKLQPLTLKEVEKGFVLVDYYGAPLGFLKNLGNRTNNLFPSAWRIRK